MSLLVEWLGFLLSLFFLDYSKFFIRIWLIVIFFCFFPYLLVIFSVFLESSFKSLLIITFMIITLLITSIKTTFFLEFAFIESLLWVLVWVSFIVHRLQVVVRYQIYQRRVFKFLLEDFWSFTNFNISLEQVISCILDSLIGLKING